MESSINNFNNVISLIANDNVIKISDGIYYAPVLKLIPSGALIPPHKELIIKTNTGKERKYKGKITFDTSGEFMVNNIDIYEVKESFDVKDAIIGCCTNKYDKELCGDFHGSSRTCDIMMSDYCSSDGKGLAVCSCYNIPESVGKSGEILNARPDCWNATCSRDGYKPSSYSNISCPTITICEQNIDTLGNENELTDNVQILNCNVSMADETIEETDGENVYKNIESAKINPTIYTYKDDDSQKKYSEQIEKYKKIMAVIILGFVWLIIILTIIIIRGQSNEKKIDNFMSKILY